MINMMLLAFIINNNNNNFLLFMHVFINKICIYTLLLFLTKLFNQYEKFLCINYVN